MIKQVDAHYDPNQKYVVVAPHRTWLDPIMIGINFRNPNVQFLAKQELASNKLFKFLLEDGAGVFLVDREHPDRKLMKQMVKELKNGQNDIGIFPTGSRFSSEIKDGAVTLARLGRVPILPVVYQGPLTVKGLFSRKFSHRVKLAIGAPIYLPDKKRLTHEDNREINAQMADAFDRLDNNLNPNYHYDPEEELRKHREKKG
ncbi:MAG: 1-acyl-sn-glycerol-3-phosphate acyltransferase [Aerococcus sp.]|nr:1-acyl-sn-glycerol-3-phosphate acyltransferase [Aerococcus sp.]